MTPSPHACHSSFQDVVAGDGTTSVTVLCGALLKKSLELLERGAWPWLAGPGCALARLAGGQLSGLRSGA